MSKREIVITGLALTASVGAAAVVFGANAVADLRDWVSGYWRRWEIVFPLAALVPVAAGLLWTAALDTRSGRKETGALLPDPPPGGVIPDPLIAMRALVWLYQSLMHPWHWVTASLKPLRTPPTTERDGFRIGMTEWVIYANMMVPKPGQHNAGAQQVDADTEVIYWVLARKPASDTQQITTAVANGMLDATPGGDFSSDYATVRDLAVKQAQKNTYASYGVWAFVLFALSRIGGVYGTVVGVLWILAISALLMLWFTARLEFTKRRRGGGTPLWSVVVDVTVTKPDGREQHYRHAEVVSLPVDDKTAKSNPDELDIRWCATFNPDGAAVAMFTGDEHDLMLTCFVAVEQPFDPSTDKVEINYRMHPALPD